MINLGLSASDLDKFQRSLYTPPGYQLKVTVQILDLNHNYVGDVSNCFIGGQVNKSFWDIVTSGATLELLDPDNQVGFDTTNPSEGALYMDRMIKIVYSVWSQLLPRWVDVPVFCGPVIKAERDGAVLSIECQGKEVLWVAPQMAWTTKTYKKGDRLTSAVKDLIGTKGGEKRFDFPEWTRSLKKDYSLKVTTPTWDMARKLVGSRLTHQLFYDGRGYLKLRNCPTTPIFTFSEPTLTSVPKLAFESDTIRNTTRVQGATPEGKAQLIGVSELPSSDPSSSTALGINGKKRRLVEVVDDPDLNTQKEVNDEAKDTMDSLDLQNVVFDFNSFSFPHLEPGDVFQITTRKFSRNLRHKTFSIPLLANESQTNGTYRRLVPTTRKKRKR